MKCGFTCVKTQKEVPLQSIKVDVDIHDFIVCVSSTLHYVNKSDVAIETQFVFPVDDDSAVFHFEAEIDGRVIVGECQEKQQAKETYQDAMSMGHGAFMLEADDNTGDIFQMKVGNLPPQKTAKVMFSYVAHLKVDSEGVATFTLPTILNPRYNPSPEDGGVAKPATPVFTAPSKIPYTLDFKAQATSTMRVMDVTSSHVPISWQVSESGKVEIQLKEKFKFDSDIDLLIKYENPHQPSVLIEKGGEDQGGMLQCDVIMLNFFPQVDLREMATNTEFIFVVDRSGSMRGARMKQAKDTLMLFLKSLPVGCCFNIISFGSNYEVLFQNGSKYYNQESLAEAIALQSNMDANMGGTEILRPLAHMYDNMKVREGFSRQLFILTDGAVSNTRAVIQLVKEHVNDTRVFTFGIGEGASTALVKGLARVGKGKGEFVTGTDRLQPKVVSSLKLATQPAVTNIKINWKCPESVAIVPTPQKPPVLFAGEHMTSYGILNGQVSDNVITSAKLTAMIGKVEIEETVSIDFSRGHMFSLYPVHRLAAKSQIKVLEDQKGSSGEEDTKQQIVLLSTASNILSKYTAFVGVDRETREVKYERVDVPVASPIQKAYYGGSLAAFSASNSSIKYKKHKQDKIQVSSRKKSAALSTEKHSKVEVRPIKKSAALSRKMDAECFAATPEIKVHTVESLIALQSFDGSWDLSKELIDVLGLDYQDVKVSSPVSDINIWATVLSIVWLQLKFPDQSSEWEMIVAKANTWLHTQNTGGVTIDELKGQARKRLDQ